MRDVTLYTLLSLDGVAEEPGNWMFEADEDLFTNLADFINATPKHVFTSSQPSQSWSQTTIVHEPLAPYVERLKQQPGGDIGVHGSIRLAQSLLAVDLIDRLELVVVPTVAGAGRRLLTDQFDLRRLTLTKATRSATGCVFLGYQRL